MSSPLRDDPPPFDAAIVLGAMVGPDGAPSPAMRRRVGHAVTLAAAGRVGYLLMSGGPVRHPVPEAVLMRDLAIAAGLAPDRVMVEPLSGNTIGNALLCRPIVAAMGWRRLLLVTDSCHMPRALYVFRRLGLAVHPAAARPAARPGREWWLAWGREALALAWTVTRVERLCWRRPVDGPPLP